jgi:hypothetical protein
VANAIINDSGERMIPHDLIHKNLKSKNVNANKTRFLC